MRILLLDSHSLFFRAFHALPAMNMRDGTPTQALYGFSVLLLKLLREQRPAGVALARDLPEPTFRHAQYPAYKAGRARAPSPLRAQLALLPELVEALGFPLFAAPGFEADDVLATLAREFARRGAAVLLVSGDRDLLQLVDAQTEVLFVGQRGRPHVLYDRAAVEARFGLAPAQLPSYVALIGDSSDNVPKLSGVGEVTARQLIARFGSIAALLAQLDQVENTRLRALLHENAAQLRQSEQLVRLCDDVPLAQAIEARPFDAAARARVRALFERWEFSSLLPRLDKLTVESAQ
jgi:DNA polymerase-1